MLDRDGEPWGEAITAASPGPAPCERRPLRAGGRTPPGSGTAPGSRSRRGDLRAHLDLGRLAGVRTARGRGQLLLLGRRSAGALLAGHAQCRRSRLGFRLHAGLPDRRAHPVRGDRMPRPLDDAGAPGRRPRHCRGPYLALERDRPRARRRLGRGADRRRARDGLLPHAGPGDPLPDQRRPRLAAAALARLRLRRLLARCLHRLRGHRLGFGDRDGGGVLRAARRAPPPGREHGRADLGGHPRAQPAHRLPAHRQPMADAAALPGPLRQERARARRDRRQRLLRADGTRRGPQRDHRAGGSLAGAAVARCAPSRPGRPSARKRRTRSDSWGREQFLGICDGFLGHPARAAMAF